MREEIRCPECGKMLFVIVDNRYIEIKCTRNSCINNEYKLLYDLKKYLTKDKRPTKMKTNNG